MNYYFLQKMEIYIIQEENILFIKRERMWLCEVGSDQIVRKQRGCNINNVFAG